MSAPTVEGEYADLAKRLLDVRSHSADGELDCVCPFHEDSRPSLRFNIHSGLWLCNGCRKAGNANTLSRELTGEGVNQRDIDTDLAGLQLQMDSYFESQKRAWRAARMMGSPDPLVSSRSGSADAFVFGVSGCAAYPTAPETLLRRYRDRTDYWTGERGFTQDTVDTFGLGYSRIEKMHTIPIRSISGELLGVNKRDDDGYQLPARFPKKRALFGSWLVREDETTVVLGEGACDAMAFHQSGYQGLAVYGSSVSDEQVQLLHRLGVREVIMAFDNDKAGRRCTEESVQKLSRFYLAKVDWPSRINDPARCLQQTKYSLTSLLDNALVL